MGFLNRTGAEIGYYLHKKCKKFFLIIENIFKKYRKGLALALRTQVEAELGAQDRKVWKLLLQAGRQDQHDRKAGRHQEQPGPLRQGSQRK